MTSYSPNGVIIDSYIDFLGANERRVKYPRRLSAEDRLYQASRKLGKNCMELDQVKKPYHYNALVFEPLRLVSQVIKDRKAATPEKQQARLLKLGALFVERRFQPDQASRVRADLQRETCTQIAATLDVLPKTKPEKRGMLHGYLAELTTIGLINHQADRRRIGLLSLPHHDNTRNPKISLDGVFIEEREGESFQQALQVKLACQNQCASPAPNPKKDRRNYQPHIAIISGHCDLGMKREEGIENIDITVPKLLAGVTLRSNPGWSSQHQTLELYSDQLVHTILTEGATTRAGTFGIDRSN